MWKVWSTGGESNVYSKEREKSECGRFGALVGKVVFIPEREKRECGRCGALVGRVVFTQERRVEGMDHRWGK